MLTHTARTVLLRAPLTARAGVSSIRMLHSLGSDKDGFVHTPIAGASKRTVATHAPPNPNPHRAHIDTSGAKPTIPYHLRDTAWKDRKTGFLEIAPVYVWPGVVAFLGFITLWYYQSTGKGQLELESNQVAPKSPYHEPKKRLI
ncbi:hypothetical protein JCM10450v2_000409 [Rhodotorula kratochvilovae]